MSEEEKIRMKETEDRLNKIAHEEEENQKALARIMKKSKDAAAKAEKHMSFREKSIKAREEKKKKQRRAFKGLFDTLKLVMIALALTCVVIGFIAIAGCEFEVDGLKETFVCKIGVPPEDERRRFLRH